MNWVEGDCVLGKRRPCQVVACQADVILARVAPSIAQVQHPTMIPTTRMVTPARDLPCLPPPASISVLNESELEDVLIDDLEEESKRIKIVVESLYNNALARIRPVEVVVRLLSKRKIESSIYLFRFKRSSDY